MPQKFNYKSTVKGVQNKLIAQSIRESANLDFLKSEESITSVIKSYQDRFGAVEGMLFDAAQYVATSADLIRVELLNEMFESIFIDLSALYGDLDLVDRILKLNLGRNKNYFLVIKKRIKDLWNRLHLTRLLTYDDNPADESFYESFFTKINAKRLDNIIVDKKNGVMTLSRDHSRAHTQSSIVKQVISTTYPEANDFGGVKFTGSILNNFVENYTNGPRDMLENGLWKEQILCNEIPDLNINIGSSGTPIYRNYKGIVSLVDIEYTYPVEINRLDLDVFGELNTKVDAILYKTSDIDNWITAKLVDTYRIPIESKFGSPQLKVGGDAFDLISFYNIEKIKAKHLRLVLNQENYIFLDSKDIKETTVDTKIQEDLAERRYEVVKFGSDLDDLLAKPTNDENTSLYFQLIDIIESTRNVQDILTKIDNVLNPKINVVSYDFERTSRFEIGAWSIEPKLEKYSRARGSFDSMAYTLPDRALTSVSIITKQDTPKSSTANWYVSVGGKDIPIVENNNTTRREILNPIDMTQYTNFSKWTTGTFFLLDFPIDPFVSDQLYLSINGTEFIQITNSSNVAYLNSRLLYIDDIRDPFASTYVIQYPIASKQSVNLFGLKPKPGTNAPLDVTLDVVSSRREVLTAFIDLPDNTLISSADPVRMSDMYDVVNVVSTIEESKLWFRDNFSSAVFVGNSVSLHFDLLDTTYNNIVSYGQSKASSTLSDLQEYLGGVQIGLTDLIILSTLPGVSPIGITRSI